MRTSAASEDHVAKQYRLAYTMRPPSYDTEDKYLAEVPALPGCRAGGDTPEETLEILESVAAAFIDSRKERGESLPESYWAVGEIVVAA